MFGVVISVVFTASFSPPRLMLQVVIACVCVAIGRRVRLFVSTAISVLVVVAVVAVVVSSSSFYHTRSPRRRYNAHLDGRLFLKSVS